MRCAEVGCASLQHWTALVTAVAGLNLVGPQEAQAANSPYVPARYRLVWSDEFEGNSLNASNWTPATGAWGDNMQMVYKDQPRNLYVKDGSLHLVAYYEKGGVKTNVCGGQKVKTGKTAFRAVLHLCHAALARQAALQVWLLRGPYQAAQGPLFLV